MIAQVTGALIALATGAVIALATGAVIVHGAVIVQVTVLAGRKVPVTAAADSGKAPAPVERAQVLAHATAR